MMSWAAANRMVEREKASNPEYSEQLTGRPLRMDAKDLTDEELVEKLRTFDVDIDRTSLEQLCETALSVEEIVRPILHNRVFKNQQEKLQGDWIWICLTELWSRWFPEKICFELLDDKMQDGYDLAKSGQAEAACSLWLIAWSNVQAIFAKTKLQSIKELDDLFKGSQFLSNWVQDLEMVLWDVGLTQPPFITSRILLCEEMLERFSPNKTGKDSDHTTGNWRRALAESYFRVGKADKAEALYREWLHNDPQWGWGWIAWADCYYFEYLNASDLERSEQLLRQGLSIADVRDSLDLLERLADVLEEQGLSVQASEIRQQLRDRASVLSSPQEFLFNNSLMPKSVGGEWGLDSSTGVATARKVSASMHTVGRKQPCPCGSGKKFKRCCGSGS